MTEDNDKKSRRGMARYRENPFLDVASDATKTRARRITNTTGDRLMVVSEQSGEVLGPTGFWHTEEVDKTQFVKLYVNGVKAFKELTAAGTKVFELLYLEMQKNIGKDQVHLSFQSIDQDVTPISERTFYRGMQELVAKGFLAESVIMNFYFVNPDYVWNGDRLAFVKTYRLKRDVKPTAIDQHTAQLPFEEAPALPNPTSHGKKKAEKSNPPKAKKTVKPAPPVAKKAAAKTPRSRSKK